MAEDLGMTPLPETVEVRDESSVGEARRATRTIAAAMAFAPQACEQLVLAATELATNLVKHALGGTLTLTPLNEGGRVGLEIELRDAGPGIAEVEQAIGDRFSSAGTRGTGLGAVNRLMDVLDIASQVGRGTRITCRKWRRDYPASVRPCPLAFGVATRPRTFGDLNGDAFVVRQWAESSLVGIIDGLGHGHFAHRAAQSARQYVESHFDLPLDEIFRGAGRACRATRGVVMTLARFDWAQGRMAYAMVGNVSASSVSSFRPVPFRHSPRSNWSECAQRRCDGTSLVPRPRSGASFRRDLHALGLAGYPRLDGDARRRDGPGTFAGAGQGGGRRHGYSGAKRDPMKHRKGTGPSDWSNRPLI